MIKGATGKRFKYFFCSILRFVCFLGLLIAYIVVKVTVTPAINWLNALLLYLTIGCLVSGVFNLILCGMPATAYKQNKLVQILCAILTTITGGIGSTALCISACAMKVLDEEIENENIIKIKKGK